MVTTLRDDSEGIRGFLDGFAQGPEASRQGEYVQGYLAAEELRLLRYRREFPERR